VDAMTRVVAPEVRKKGIQQRAQVQLIPSMRSFYLGYLDVVRLIASIVRLIRAIATRLLRGREALIGRQQGAIALTSSAA
jgi:hypothetical protein